MHSHTLFATAAALSFLAASAEAQCEFAEIQPTVPIANGWFGWDCALAADRMAISQIALGPFDEESVTIYKRSGLNWFFEAKLINQTGFSDSFGYSIGFDQEGTTLVVGALGDNQGGSDAGRVYVYDFDGVNWVKTTELIGSTTQNSDFFGTRVAIDDDIIVAGAFNDDDAGCTAGTAFVFEKIGGIWQETALLVGHDTTASDTFGKNVDVRNGVIVVGADGHDSNGVFASGALYVFEKIGGTWIETAELIASDAGFGDKLEYCTVGRDTVFGGASLRGGPGGELGAVYVFQRDGFGGWVETQILVPSDGGGADFFGGLLDTDEVTFVSGSVGNGNGKGAVYAFQEIGGLWTEVAKFVPAGAQADNGQNFGSDFGIGVAVLGDVIAGGGWLTDVNVGDDAGKAWTFSLSGTLCPTLSSSRSTLSLTTGGSKSLDIDADDSQAGAFYWSVGSLSGSDPGFPLGGLQVPINPDDYFALTLTPNAPGSPLKSNTGMLDSNGDATVVLSITPGTDASLAGLEVIHAVVAFGLGPFSVTHVSNTDTTLLVL